MKTFLKYNKYQWFSSIGFMIAGGSVIEAQHGNWIVWILIAILAFLFADHYALYKNNT